MKPLVMILAANEVRQVGVGGTIFELRTAPFMVEKIELLDANNTPVGIMEEAEATDKERLPVPFSTVRITNGPNAQTVRFYYGTGDAGSNRFTGVVSGEVDLTAGTLATIDLLLQDAAMPYESTGSYVGSSDTVANTPITLFTPGANTGGAILISAHGEGLNPVLLSSAFIAKTSAPIDQTDGEIIVPLETTGLNGSNWVYSGRIHVPQKIAAGKGLYFISNGALVGGYRSARWKLL